MTGLKTAYDEAARAGQEQERQRLYGEQNFEVLKRWVEADIAGVDPDEFSGGTEMLDWDLVRSRMAANMDRKLDQLTMMVNSPELDQRIGALEQQTNGLLAQYRELNSVTLSQYDPGDPQRTQEERILSLKPLPMTDELYTQLTNELAAINRQAKEIDPNFNVYSHPRTAKLAHVLTRTVGPSFRGYFGRQDPEIDYGSFVPESLKDYIPEWVAGGAGRAASVGYNAIDGLASIAGAVGVAAYDNTSRLAAFIEEQVTGQPSSWTPTTFFTQDANGNTIPLDGGKFSMPEIAGLIVGAATKEDVIDSMASFREAHGRQETFSDLSVQGILNSVGYWTGSFSAFGVTGGAVMETGVKAGSALAARQGVIKGTAWMFGSNTARANVLRTKMLETFGAASALGTHDMLLYGNHEGFISSFTHGAIMAPILRVAGAVADRGEDILARGSMPGFIARGIGGMMEGLVMGGGMAATGAAPYPLFGPESPEAKSLWELMKDPSDENFKGYMDYVGEMILGSVVQRAMFGGRAMREREAMRQREDDLGGSRSEIVLGPDDLGGGGGGVAELAPKDRSEFARAGEALRKRGEQQAEVEQRLQGKANQRWSTEGTENLMGRMMNMARRRVSKLAKPGIEGDPIEFGAASIHIGGKTVTVPYKGERGKVDREAGRLTKGPSVSLDDMQSKLVDVLLEQGVTPQEIGQAINEGKMLTKHFHPGGETFSPGDFRYLIENKGTPGESVPDLVVTAEGGWVLRRVAESDLTPSDVQQMQDSWNDVKEQHYTEAGAEHGLSGEQVMKAYRRFQAGIKGFTGAERAAIDTLKKLRLDFIQEQAGRAGLEVTFLDPQQLQRAWAGYHETGKFDPLAKEAPHEAEVRETFQRDTGKELEQMPMTRSQQGEVLAAAKEAREMIRMRGGSPEDIESEVDNFIDSAAEHFGDVVRDLPRTMDTLDAIVRAAGVEQEFAPEGQPSRREPAPAEPLPVADRLADAGLELVTRPDGSFDVRGENIEQRAAQAGVELVERPGGGFDVIDREFPGKRSQRFETDSPAPDETELRRIGRLEAGAVPEGMEAVEKMLEAGKPETPKSTYEKAKRAARSFADHLGKFFTDDEYRAGLAKRLEAIGYRKKFLALKQDEKMVLAQTDKVRAEVRRSPEQTRADRAYIFEPILRGYRRLASDDPNTKYEVWDDTDATPEVRKQQLDRTIQYAVLRDLAANYVRRKRMPNGEEVEVRSDLPFGTTIEAIQEKITELNLSMTDGEKESFRRMREVLDDAWQSMARRGLVRMQDKLPDYFPRRIKDWADIFDALGPGSPRPPVREPIRGYLKQRKGSQRLPEVSLDALTDYLTKVRVDNAWHDYANEVGFRIQSRLEEELTEEGIDIDPETIKSMSDEEWQQLYEHLERDRGLIVIDVQGGRVGERTLERDPVTQKIMSEIAAATGLAEIPEAVLGGAFRPDPEAGRYLVTKKAYEFLREARMPSGWNKMPLLAMANRIIGKWFKGPALRGMLGMATPARVARNLFSDATSLLFKTEDGFKALRESMRQLPQAHRIIRAHTTGDDSRLSNYEKSVLAEMREFGTIQDVVRGAEFAADSELEREWIKKVMPETNRLLDAVSVALRGDFRWAKSVDDYAENILRSAYFLRERFARFQELQGHPDADRLAAEDAHITAGEVLVNYNHLTPGERMALNGVLFPFYTWAKGNFTRSLGQLVRHPAKQAARYGAYMAPAVVWNLVFAREEEERLWHSNPLIAGRSHLILPWMRDEFGNPFVVSFEDTASEAARMLGMNSVFQDAYQFAFGHQSWEEAMREPVKVMDNAKRSLNNWTAPWVRAAFGTSYKSKYETLGERAENTFSTDIITSFRPIADAQSLLNMGRKDRSTGERWLRGAPFIGFVDITKGLPGSQITAEHLAGRVQRRSAMVNEVIQGVMPRFMAGLLEGDAEMMQSAIRTVWNRVGDDLESAGLSQAHVVARIQRAAEREIVKRQTIESGGILSPKFYQLSRTQQAEVLFDLIGDR